jgi:hypothetical protein
MLGSRDAFWAELGLQYRLRLEVHDGADLSYDEGDTLLAALQRARVHLDANYRDWLRAFVQLQDSRTLGYGNASFINDGSADIHQAWVSLRAGSLFSVGAGRQVLAYGDQRLVGVADWSNVGRTFDALRLRFTYPSGRVDVFGAVFTPHGGGNLVKGTWFVGAYNATELAGGSIDWDLYALGLLDSPGAMPPGVVYGSGADPATGPERQLATVGTRLRVAGRGLAAGIEGALQLGRHHAGYDDASASIGHAAWALHADLAYEIDVQTRPRIEVAVNHASGNDRDARTWNRFDNLFPTNHSRYGRMDLLGWSASLSGSVGFGISPHRRVSLSVDYWVLARGSRHDGWYSSSGAELAPPPSPSDPHARELLLGHEVDLGVDVSIGSHARVHGGAGVFVPRGYGRVRGSDPQLWGYTMLVVDL